VIRHQYTLAALALVLLAGCRGQPSEKPPVHLFGDMDWQPKVQPLEASPGVADEHGNKTPIFEDGRGMRPLVAGTVAQGELREDDALYRGMVDGKHVAHVPMKVDEAMIRRGQDRFNIYCTPCHDKTGGGRGTVIQRGFPPPVDLASDRVLQMPDGQIFDTISNGARNMPAYRKQIPVEDRWAIATWVRVLQHSQHGKIDDVPAAEKGRILPEEGGDAAAKGAK